MGSQLEMFITIEGHFWGGEGGPERHFGFSCGCSFMRVETTVEVAMSVLVNPSPLPSFLLSFFPLPNRLISEALRLAGWHWQRNQAKSGAAVH